MAKKAGSRVAPQVVENLPERLAELDDGTDITKSVIYGNWSARELDEPEFRECRFHQVQLTGALIRFGRFIDCVISDSDLSGATLEECSFTRVEFHSCRASGLQASQARFIDVGIFASRLDGANFRMSSWQRAELVDCDLTEADFGQAKLPGGRIIACNLSRTDLSRAHLAGGHLLRSNLDELRGGEALRGVTISTDQIVPAALSLFAGLNIAINDDA